MKRILFYSIIVSLLLPSCSTTKRVQESRYATAEATEQADLHAESHRTIESVVHTATESVSTEGEEIRRIELEFDTTQPVDSATGTPPLKRATITDRRQNRETNTRRQTADTLRQQTETTLQDSTRREAQTETIAELETEKKSRPSSLPWLLVGIVLIALGWAVWKR
ncbi:hypothetical protein [Rikenella microfusus]|uniref:hypothetical protein n=1 Tax=Rikenella microfusus TaxID=28139 RepID=UPI00248D60DA|nr:hypothetical protein [Rikenella microfusus]